jgi:lipooligosaccharide transport system ATP-binding protein
MKRRLIIAGALIHCPNILLLDEPTTGLDPNVRQEIWDKLAELRREDNLTIRLSTYYMDEVENIFQRIIIQMEGNIVAEGEPKDLIQTKVKKFALEIRETDGLRVQTVSSDIFPVHRGSAHIYFGKSIDSLTLPISHYGTRQILFRPSNLEDVFPQLMN